MGCPSKKIIKGVQCDQIIGLKHRRFYRLYIKATEAAKLRFVRLGLQFWVSSLELFSMNALLKVIRWNVTKQLS
jgi:hypothetical protein